MVKCSNCGTEIAHTAAMCYACGADLRNPFNLGDTQLDIYRQANAAMDGEQWQTALGHYSRLSALRPDVGCFHICMATAYAFLGDDEKAWDCLTAGIEADPTDMGSWDARLEFSLEHSDTRFKEHVADYLVRFKESSEHISDLAGKILNLSDAHAQTVTDLCKHALHLNPENRKAMKLMRKMEKGSGLFSRLFK